ncbi:hypothetical protein LCGC14_2983840, partial [marine sediment metagenome]
PVGGVPPDPAVAARIAELQTELQRAQATESPAQQLSATSESARLAREVQTLQEQVAPTLRQVPFEPEAGVQAGALGVPDVDVRPVGRGEVTQVSLDDQLKLQQAREAAQPVRPVDVELFELGGELAVKQELIKEHPLFGFVAKFRVTPSKIDPIKGRQRPFRPTRDIKLTSFLDSGGRFPETVTEKQALALLGQRFISPNVVSKAGRVSRQVALDEIVRQLAGFEQGADLTADDVAGMIEQLAADQAEIVALQDRIADVEAGEFESAVPSLPIPAEQPSLPGVKGSDLPPPPTHAPATVPPVDPPTTPPPPTIAELPGAPIPARRFPGLLPDLQAIDPLISQATNPDVARKVANLPGVRSLQKHLNPA